MEKGQSYEHKEGSSMDPNQRLFLIVEAAIHDGDGQAVKDYANALAEWLEDGNFRPTLDGLYQAGLEDLQA